jgi:hypothetical protein
MVSKEAGLCESTKERLTPPLASSLLLPDPEYSSTCFVRMVRLHFSGLAPNRQPRGKFVASTRPVKESTFVTLHLPCQFSANPPALMMTDFASPVSATALAQVAFHRKKKLP